MSPYYIDKIEINHGGCEIKITIKSYDNENYNKIARIDAWSLKCLIDEGKLKKEVE